MFVEDQEVIEDEPVPEFNHDQISQKVDTIKFSIIVGFFNKISTLRGKKKSDYIKKFLKMLFKYNRKPQFTYSILRVILPADDRERGNYGIKEKNLASIVCKSLNLSKNQLQRLRRYKNPNSHQSGIGTGDFALCLYDIIKGLCKNTSTMTIKTLNELLDEMVEQSNSQQQQSDIFRKFCQNSNAEEIKWIARIILKDLKLNIKIDHVLNTFHPDGNDYYNLTNSIKETCKKLQNLQTSLNDDIALFHPIRPMLAGKKNINYFKDMTKEYFVETKYDGERLQVHLEKDKIKVFSRNGVDYNHVYENMLPIFKEKIECDSCILDGEIIVLQKQTLKMQPFGLNKVVALGQDDSDMQLCYKIFDILWLKIQNEQINLMSHPLKERKALLEKVIREVPGRIQIVKFRQISKYEGILTEFNESMERNQEGIMIKDPDSLYIPKERAINWLKLKGDYVDGLTDTLDLIILGGYYGSASYRAQGTHWSDRITTFLMGVIDKIDEQNPKNSYAIPFCKVGTGYKGEELQELRNRLKRNLVQNKGIKPSFLVGNWKPKLDDKPDCYINYLPNSVILEVKAAQLIASEAFGAPVTVRFPRVEKIRYDKDWNEAMTHEDLKNMQNQEKYSKNIRRKRAGSQEDEERPNEEDRIRKKKKQEKVKKHNVIMDNYQCVDIGQQNLKSHLFTDMEFYVFQLQNSVNTKHQVEKQILLNNGKVVQNPLITTQYVVSDRIDFKLQLLQKNHRKTFTFIQPRFIFNCIKAEKLLPLSPIYLTILPSQKKTYYIQNFDKFGDSYTSYLDRRQLDEILGAMKQKNQTFPIDKKLDEKISLPLIRKQKKTLAFGLNPLQKIRLKMHGNKFVDSFSELPNSIIYAFELPPKIVKQMNNYLEVYPQTKVETVENLESQLIL